MIYLDDGFFAHPKVLAAGGEATLLYLKALGWLKQQGSTDGRIPKLVLPILAPDIKAKPISGRPLAALASRLVDVALWDDNPTHWICHGFVERNAKAIAKSQQARDAARQRHAKTPQSTKRTQTERTSGNAADADAEPMRTQDDGSCVRNAVSVSHPHPQPHTQPTATSPSPEPKSRGAHQGVGANPSRKTGPAHADPQDQGFGHPEATGPHESPDDRNRRRALALRWQDVLHERGTQADLPACNRAVAEALHHADARIVDEQIGWQLTATTPPRTPHALVTAVHRITR